MEDTFKVRVDKAFGSLEPSSSSSTIKSTSPSLTSLWSLTDEEIETNKWIKPKIDPQIEQDDQIHRLKNPKPYSPFLKGLLPEQSTSDQNLESDIQELDDDDDDDEDDENRQPVVLPKPDDHNEEEWSIRSSVGLDCTLDNEEEEDAYDKVAVGKEESAERFYMKNVNDYEIDMDSNNELPNSFTGVIRDPRANHMAAKLRLKEDDESAKKLGLQVPENNIQESNKIATESNKHVVKNQLSGSKVFPQSSSSLPDYLKNPSKYTRYTFDSKDDVDEESNRSAYVDFFNSVKESSDMEIQRNDDVSTDSIKSIIFTPKKKSSDVSMKISNEDKKVGTISIDESEICMMDEDEPETAIDKNRSLQKSGRKYRTKGNDHVE